MTQFCRYYIASIPKKNLWFVSGILRAEENKWFYRTCDGTSEDLEFFVPEAYHTDFELFMQPLIDQGYVRSLQQQENPRAPRSHQS